MSGPQDQQEATKRGQSTSDFQDQQEAIKRTFSPAPAASPVISCPKSALTQQQAQERFDKFKCREDIPWDYPHDCCYNRAHVMAKELEAEGVDVGKIWNYPPSPRVDNLLRVSTPHDESGYVEWRYHVAPTVPIMDSKGNVSRMVFDPSITDSPITLAQWKALQGQPLSDLVATNAAPYFRQATGKVYAPPLDDEVRRIFNDHREARDNLAGKK